MVLFIHLLRVFLTPLPLIPFTFEEISPCTNEAAKVLTKLQEIRLLVFLFHYFLFQ